VRAEVGAAMSGLEQGGAPEPRGVLLVEDDRSLAAMLKEIFGSAGYGVDLARDGQAGLHLGLSRSYDVIVLDRGLPAIEGLDLLRRLRAQGVAIPVLVLSALGLARNRVDGLDASAEDYLAKPFDIDEHADPRTRSGLTPTSTVLPAVAQPVGALFFCLGSSP
jgi:CheY-like chemotaxis protein